MKNTTKTQITALDTLRQFLSQIPAGDLSGDIGEQAIKLLQNCWGDLAGAGIEATRGYKLKRAEGLTWQSPSLSFKLERHGGTCMGSTRAEIHAWVVDVEKAVAEMSIAGRRQLYPMDAPFTKKRAQERAAEILNLIQGGMKDDTLKWHADGSVTLILNRSVEAKFESTRKNRVKILLRQLLPMLEENGWHRMESGSRYRFGKAEQLA